MAICYLGCEESLAQMVRSFPTFTEAEVIELQFPITASDVKIDILIVGPNSADLARLAATISDWNLPPATLFVLAED
jgi:hypothetical protein